MSGCPVAWSERHGGFWVVSRYDDAVEIARDSVRFNNSGEPQFGTPRPPLEVDRPLARPLPPPPRSRTSQSSAWRSSSPRVRAFVDRDARAGARGGGGDLAEALTYPLPARVLCAWLGLPDSEWAYLKRVSDELFDAEEGRGDDPETRARCNEELYSFSRRLVRERTETPLDPEVDLISGLLGASRGDYVVTEEDVVQVVRLLIVAGHNSTTGAIGNCILRLATHRDVQQRLRAEPELLPVAVEEFLRLDASVQAMPRWANEDTEIHGRHVAQGREGDAALGIGEPRSRAFRRA